MQRKPELRLRLKADGRIVEVLADGREIALDARLPNAPMVARRADATADRRRDAAYTRGLRAAARLTQAEFASRIGVPIETLRNWEQGKRSPRGPARALLRVIEAAPDLAFAALAAPASEAS
jgi:putative transcriptional regulator